MKFQLSPSAYYNYKKNKKKEYHEQQEVILNEIRRIYYDNNRVVGHRIVRILLARRGIVLSKTTVHKYMNKMLNLTAVKSRRKPRYMHGQKDKIFDNLLKQDFAVAEKNKVWCIDFTYMRMYNNKFRYNCSIIDLYDRVVVASANDNFINTDLAIAAVSKALEQEGFPQGLILHSDQGSQFASFDFVNFCKQHGIQQSMSKAGCPYDNAPMERYYRTFKYCFFHRCIFKDEQELDDSIRRFENWYNYVRPHSYNGYLTPMEARYR